MIRLAVVVEGETEEEFVKSLLATPLSGHGVHAYAICLRGNVSVERLVPEMVRLQWDFDFVTSLVDFYGFRGKLADETVEQLEARVGHELENQLGVDHDAAAYSLLAQTLPGLLGSLARATALMWERKHGPTSMLHRREIRGVP